MSGCKEDIDRSRQMYDERVDPTDPALDRLFLPGAGAHPGRGGFEGPGHLTAPGAGPPRVAKAPEISEAAESLEVPKVRSKKPIRHRAALVLLLPLLLGSATASPPRSARRRSAARALRPRRPRLRRGRRGGAPEGLPGRLQGAAARSSRARDSEAAFAQLLLGFYAHSCEQVAYAEERLFAARQPRRPAGGLAALHPERRRRGARARPARPDLARPACWATTPARRCARAPWSRRRPSPGSAATPRAPWSWCGRRAQRGAARRRGGAARGARLADRRPDRRTPRCRPRRPAACW